MRKRAFDLVLSGIGLIASAPVWLITFIAVRLEDRGPLLFVQDRVGQHGRVFRALKFRSMVINAEQHTGPVQAVHDDPRVTRTGRFLRATALDELPQLVNIFRGDMSFVGPRPLRPGETDTTAAGNLQLADIPGYEARHRVRPGLTGLAQVRARRDLPRTGKFRYDLLYQRRGSFCFDLQLILQSITISLRGAWERHDGKPRRGRRS